MVDVFIAGGRRVRAQRGLVAGHGGGHAKARVGINVVGAKQSLGELVEDVIVLGEQLSGNVESHGIGTMFADDCGEPVRGMAQRLVPAGAYPR